MTLRFANEQDIHLLEHYDHHVNLLELKILISLGRVIIAEKDGEFCGWLRYNLFWDNTPFMNMLFIIDKHRNNGIGSMLMKYWESNLKNIGYDRVMTSTLSNENAQHFYRKHGYVDAGSLLLPGEPLEIIFIKDI
jgi:GNAT superfamily N-acetyltransferase